MSGELGNLYKIREEGVTVDGRRILEIGMEGLRRGL
jgi:hypothetical protein